LIGIAVSLIVGSFLAIITESSKLLDALFSPLLTVIKSTPIASFIILTLLWIEKNSIPVFIISLIVVPIVWSNISAGIRSVDKNLFEVSRIYSFSIPKRILKLYIPSIFPYFLAACKASLGMAWKAGISAEILSTPKDTIGTELYFSKTYLETPSLFAWTVVVIILSIIIEKIFVYGLEALGKRLRLLKKGDENAKI
jgi:NitT/TauT family transport system permease protein